MNSKLPPLPAVEVIGFIATAEIRDEAALAAALARQLQLRLNPAFRLMAISSLANVPDLLFARAALQAEIPLTLLLLATAEDLTPTFPAHLREDLSSVLARAARQEGLQLPTGVSPAAHLVPRLVDQSDLLLVVREGADNEPPAPSAEVTAYATRRERAVIGLWETPEGIAIDDSPAAPAPAPSQADIGTLCTLLAEPPPAPVIPREVVTYFNICDAQATQAAPQVRRYVLNIVLANAIASMAGAVGSSFPHPPLIGTILTSMKFAAIFLGLGIFALLRHRQSQNTWLKLRLQAEICRSVMATWSSPRPVEPVSIDEVPELRGLIRALNYLRLTQPHPPSLSLEAFKADYGQRRLADQHRYFHAQSAAAARVSTWLAPSYWVLTLSALLTSGLSVFISFTPGTLLNFSFVFLPIVAPILASWILAWQAIESVSRKKARFAEMERLTQRALIDLIHCHSWDTVHHVVKKAERVLLNEVLEWYSFVKYK